MFRMLKSSFSEPLEFCSSCRKRLGIVREISKFMKTNKDIGKKEMFAENVFYLADYEQKHLAINISL